MANSRCGVRDCFAWQLPYRIFLTSCLLSLALPAGLEAVGGDYEQRKESGPLNSRISIVPGIPYVPDAEKVVRAVEAVEAVEIDPATEKCNELESKLSAFNPLPLVDWLNVSNLPSFFDPTLRSLMNQEEYFTAVDSLGRYDLAVQPFGFYSSYKLGTKTFKLSTLGITVSGSVTLGECWVVGGGLGYSHSSLDWGLDAKKNSSNSLYFGPYIGYIFEKAYIDLTLLGAYNIHNIGLLLQRDGRNDKKNNESWDIEARLEGGWSYEWTRYFGNHFFIQPHADLSYLAVFQNKIDERDKLEQDKIKSSVDVRSYEFLRSRLALSCRKEFHHKEKGILIPTLSLGWVLMQPFTPSKFSFTCGNTSEKKSTKSKAYPSSNQAYIGLQIQAIAPRGIMLTLDGEAYLANFYPVYLGSIRVEWSW